VSLFTLLEVGWCRRNDKCGLNKYKW